MPRVVPVMRYVVGVVVVEDILAKRKRGWFVWGWMWLLSMWTIRCLLDPIVVVLMPAYQEGGWEVVSFVPLSFFASTRDTC